jgi:hypothetical protein
MESSIGHGSGSGVVWEIAVGGVSLDAGSKGLFKGWRGGHGRCTRAAVTQGRQPVGVEGVVMGSSGSYRARRGDHGESKEDFGVCLWLCRCDTSKETDG